MKIGVIEGSVRQGRNSSAVTGWVLDRAAAREGVEFELIDLAEFNLPMLDGPVPPLMLNGNYPYAEVTQFSARIAACDAFVFVTPEYNHSIPAVLKNAIDWLAPEWMNKPAALIGYGSTLGIRAVEHLRHILANFNMYVIQSQGALSIFTDFADGAVVPNDRLNQELDALLDQLVETTRRFNAG